MDYDKFKYVILNNEKTPIHKFKDGGKSWDEVKDFDNIAVLIPEPYIVLDFDTVSDSRIALEIVKATGLKCSVMRTTRGVHIWVKSSEPLKNTVKAKLTTGLYADFRSWGKPCYTKIKDKGIMRAWEIEHWEDMDSIPPYFKPAGRTGNSFDFKDLKSGDGRNQKLFNYVLYLQTQGHAKDDIKQIIQLINTHVFAEPVPDRELKTILRDEAFKSDEEVAELIESSRTTTKFEHDIFGQQIMSEKKIITVNNVLYMYADGYYKPAQELIEYDMIQRCSNIKTNQRQEVLNYLKIQTRLERELININPYIINLRNGRLDIRTGKLMEHSPDFIEFERLPLVYDADCTCEAVDKLVSNVFCSDQECIDLFWEVMGNILLHSNPYQRAFLFVGEGSNGKSSILKMMREFIGYANSTTIGIDELQGFKLAELENKLLNVGDDIENKPIKNSGMLKKLFSSEPIIVEKKFQNPVTIQPYCTHVFSCNQIPRNNDRTNGMYRRWVIVPFDATFSASDEDYDPYIGEKVTTEEAKSYILNKALEGFKRLYKRGYYIEPARAKARKDNFVIENSSVLSWIDDKELKLSAITAEPRDNLYTKYRLWCTDSGIEPCGKISFYKEVCNKFGVVARRNSKKDSRDRWYFMVNIDL